MELARGIEPPTVAGSALKPASPIPTKGAAPLYGSRRLTNSAARTNVALLIRRAVRPHEEGIPSSELPGWRFSVRAGAGERNRTSNLRFTKPLLCRLSYASVLSEGTLNSHCLASSYNDAHLST